MYNATLSRQEQLRKVPLEDGSLPTVDYPTTLMELLVAGNEVLPDNTRNAWNKKKSMALLRAYNEDADDSDTDNEYTSKSRSRRLRVAKVLGITSAQLNFAQLAL
jgi:hypothetical protein